MTETAVDASHDHDRFLSLVREKDAFNNSLGIEVVSATPERAETRLLATEAHLNFFGVCHGGLVFSLADAAFGIAANAGGRRAAMIDAHITMTAAVRPGEELAAISERVSQSRRLAVYRVIVRKRAQGDAAEDMIVGTFTGTVYVSGP